jgi:uncharacterized protein with von Willebrand factor type A (vWA) domain
MSPARFKADISSISGPGLPPAVIELGVRLKGDGVPVHPGAVQDALKSLTHLNISQQDDLRWALKMNLVTDPDHYPKFDRYFEEIFFGRREAEQQTCPSPQADGAAAAPTLVETTSPPDDEKAAYSPVEVLSNRDLAEMDPADQELARRLIRELVRPLAFKRSRRFKPARRGRQVHFRRTMRRSLQAGGELVDLVRKARRPRRRRLVLLADVSGSMDPYLSFVLALVTSLGRLGREVNVFTFATRLTEVTGVLKRADPGQVRRLLGSRVPDWSGGTRIGSALEEFNRRFAPRLAPAKFFGLIYSDGWDQGAPELLSAQMARLAGYAHQVLWLNPLLKGPHYEPTCLGMRAALPFIDRLLPVHTVRRLREVAEFMAR